VYDDADGWFANANANRLLDAPAVTITAVPLTPSLVTVIVAVPAPTAVTTPVAFAMVATAALFVDHAIVRPGSTFPLASFASAASCSVAPG
jgi:hypothetical protein